MLSLQEVARFLREHDHYEILTHASPDGDTLGSGYALCRVLRRIGKRARVVNTNLPRDFVFLTEGLEEQSFAAETIVSVDIADEKLLGDNRKAYSGKIDLCIDHHAVNRVEAPLKYVEAGAAANCEILFLLFREMGVLLTPEIATCLYTGISTDTGCFKYSNTTARTLRIAADLLDCGVDAAPINKAMFDTKSRRKLALEQEVYRTMRFSEDGRCAIAAVTLEAQRRLGVGDDELEGIAALPRQIEGVVVGITLREQEPEVFKVSVRSDERLFDASVFCAGFGGGGHAAAAGCRVKGTLQEVAERLQAAAAEVL
ncbi:MAG: DHH family phosphoesterase [Ruminococcus sp.]|nr:DHH family phosphoesterase [Ruminococcus sp.]